MAQASQERNETGNQEVVSDHGSQQKPQSEAEVVSDGICDPGCWGTRRCKKPLWTCTGRNVTGLAAQMV